MLGNSSAPKSVTGLRAGFRFGLRLRRAGGRHALPANCWRHPDDRVGDVAHQCFAVGKDRPVPAAPKRFKGILKHRHDVSVINS